MQLVIANYNLGRAGAGRLSWLMAGIILQWTPSLYTCSITLTQHNEQRSWEYSIITQEV